MDDEDLLYFRRRALEEQQAARLAACDAARHRHDELADMYRLRVAMLSKPSEWRAGAWQWDELAEGPSGAAKVTGREDRPVQHQVV